MYATLRAWDPTLNRTPANKKAHLLKALDDRASLIDGVDVFKRTKAEVARGQ